MQGISNHRQLVPEPEHRGSRQLLLRQLDDGLMGGHDAYLLSTSVSTPRRAAASEFTRILLRRTTGRDREQHDRDARSRHGLAHDRGVALGEVLAPAEHDQVGADLIGDIEQVLLQLRPPQFGLQALRLQVMGS